MNTKLYVILLASSFGLMILGAIVGGILESSGIVTRETLGPKGVTAVVGFYLLLFIVGAFALVPLLVRWFTSAQIKIGNDESFIIRWLEEHEQAAVYGIWGLFFLGLCMAVPAMLKSGVFK